MKQKLVFLTSSTITALKAEKADGTWAPLLQVDLQEAAPRQAPQALQSVMCSIATARTLLTQLQSVLEIAEGQAPSPPGGPAH